MSAASTEPVSSAGRSFAERIGRNEAALERYRAQRADRLTRGVSVRTSDRVISRLEAETTLLRSWSPGGGGPPA